MLRNAAGLQLKRRREVSGGMMGGWWFRLTMRDDGFTCMDGLGVGGICLGRLLDGGEVWREGRMGIGWFGWGWG